MSKQPISWIGGDDDSSDDDDEVVEVEEPIQSLKVNDNEVECNKNDEPSSSSSVPVRQSRQQNKSIPDRPPFIAYVGNLAYNVSQGMLGSFFQDGGCRVKEVHIQMRDGKPRGMAFVEFSDRESLEKALGAHDVYLENRPMTVSVAEKTQRRRDNKNRDRTDNDRRERRDRGSGRDDRVGQDGRDGRDNWNRGDNRGRGNNKDKNQRGAPPPPNPSSTDLPQRKKLELQPRQAPLETIGERVAAGSIFGEGRTREENLAMSSLNQKVDNIDVNSNNSGVNTSVENPPPSTTTDTSATTGGDDEKKKLKEQKVSRDNNHKKEKNPPRDKKNDKDHRGDREFKKGNISKSQVRKTHDSGENKPKKSDGNKDKKQKEKDTSEEAAQARFLAANEKMQKPATTTTAKEPRKANSFSLLMVDSDSDGD